MHKLEPSTILLQYSVISEYIFQVRLADTNLEVKLKEALSHSFVQYLYDRDASRRILGDGLSPILFAL